MTCNLQCIARDVDGKREVAGVHWDYDCYGAPGKMAQVGAHMLCSYAVARFCCLCKLPEPCMRRWLYNLRVN